jgi:hypothetical protein
MADSGIVHVVAAVPVTRSEYESEAHHGLAHGTAFPSSPVERQLYYRDDEHKWYIYTGSSWVELTVATVAAHKTTHQNGGSDEINVAGLSGELADDQPTTWTKVSSKPSTFTPSAHKTTHQDGGSDEISIAGLSGEPAELTTHKADPDAHHSNLASLTFVIDGGGSAITTGQKGHLEIPFACTITRVTMLADQSGSIVVDVWKDTYANFPPTDADSITASAPPTISGAQKSQDSTLTGWTKAISAGDILAFNVDSCTTIERVTISLRVTKS